MFDVIKDDLPNFPDEIILDWLEPLAVREKWPPDLELPSWRGILLKKSLEFWQKVEWTKVSLNMDQIQFSSETLKLIGIMNEAYVLNNENFFLEEMGQKGRDRFINSFKFLLKHGVFPRPLIILKDSDEHHIADGHHRYLAWAMVKLVQDLPKENEELINELHAKFGITEPPSLSKFQGIWLGSHP